MYLRNLKRTVVTCFFSYDHKYRCGKEERDKAHFIRFKVLPLEENNSGKVVVE